MWNQSLPLYKQISNKIKEEIVQAKLSGGDAIPSEVKLAKTYNVSRVTVREAIKTLVEENTLYRVQGSGTYVSHGKIEYDIFKLQGFTKEMSELHNNPSNKILEFRLTDAPNHVKEILNLTSNQKVYYIKRLRYANSEPLVLEESYLPTDLFPDLSIDIMKKSKYEYIKNKGYNIDRRFGEILPVMPNDEIVNLFEIKKTEALLVLKAYSIFKNSTPFEYSRIYFHPDKYSFKIVSMQNED